MNPSQSKAPIVTSERRIVRAPRVDAYETPESLVLLADVPGADPASVELALEQGVLSLRAPGRTGQGPGRQLLGESLACDWQRSFEIGADFDPERIQASAENGVLRIELAKAVREPRVRKIEVRPA